MQIYCVKKFMHLVEKETDVITFVLNALANYAHPNILLIIIFSDWGLEIKTHTTQ